MPSPIMGLIVAAAKALVTKAATAKVLNVATSAALAHTEKKTAKPSSADDTRELINALRSKVEQQAANTAIHAELISQIASETEALSQGLDALYRRVSFMRLVAGGATIIAIAALILALF